VEEEKILDGKFHNKSTLRKQRTKGKDIVQRDAVQILGIRGWRKQAGVRETWRGVLREARTQKRL